MARISLWEIVRFLRLPDPLYSEALSKGYGMAAIQIRALDIRT
jgi:hypothetical protein